MTTTTTDQLVIKMSLDMARLQEGLRKADAGIKKFASDMQTTIGTALDLLAIKMVMSFSKDLVNNFANTGAKLEFLSQKTGESVANLDKWGTAAAKAGGSAEGFYNTIQGLQSRLQNAKFGGDPKTMGVFSFLGINPQDAKGNIKKTTDILLELSGKLKGMSRDKQQWIGQQLGIDDATLRILAQGRQETEKFVAAQNALWDDKSADKAQKAQARLIDFDRKIEKLKLDLGDRLIPVMYKLTDWITNFIDKDLPKLVKAFDDWSNKTGITIENVLKFTGVLLGLSAAVSVVKGLSLAFTGLGAAIRLITGPIGIAVTALTSLYELWQMFKEKQENPEEFNKNMEEQIQNSSIVKSFKEFSKFAASPFDSLKNKLSDVKDDVLNWAHGMTESGNKSQIGYKMKKDVYGKSQYVLDAQGNKIPEAYGKYQIQPSTASEVMGRKVSGQELMDDKFNQIVHDKLMKKWEAQYGSKEAALAYYNGGKNGLKQLNQTGTTDYLEKIKSFVQQAMPGNVTNGNTTNTKNNTQNITISKVELHGVQNKEQLVASLMGNKLVSPALAFSNGRIA